MAVCPAAQRPVARLSCPRRFHPTTSGVSQPFTVPGPGQWRAYVWLRDAAGNESSAYAADSILRYDDTPPSVTIRAQSPNEPAVVRIRATDTLSSLAVRELLIRRRGQSSWISLPTTPDRDGFSAFVDDERLERGVYELRARAVDEAGNERTADKREDGTFARLALPLRIQTRLAVGRPKRVRARGSGGKRRYRIVLIERPRSRFGHTIPLRGRLTSPGGNPLAGKEVEVSEQTKVPGAAWRPIATLRTSQSGRFTFRALRGPSRTLRFRFGGSPDGPRPQRARETQSARVDDTPRQSRRESSTARALPSAAGSAEAASHRRASSSNCRRGLAAGGGRSRPRARPLAAVAGRTTTGSPRRVDRCATASAPVFQGRRSSRSRRGPAAPFPCRYVGCEAQLPIASAYLHH